MSVKLGRKSAKSSVNLFLGIVAQNVVLAIGAIIIGRLLGSALYGLYTFASIPSTLISLFGGLGINQATVRYAAHYNHLEQQRKVKDIVVASLSTSALVGTLLALAGFSLAGPIAAMFGRPDAELLVRIISLTILCDALLVTSQSVFVGLERTELYSCLIILRAILQTSLQPILIMQLWPPSTFEALGAVVGYAIAALATCVASLLVSYFFIIRRLSPSVTRSELWASFGTMFHYGYPLYISRVLGGLLTQFLNLLMALYASNSLIGNYRVSLNFTILLGFFAIPIAAVLFPAFSKLNSREDPESLSRIFRISVKYTSLLIIPAMMLVVVLSEPLVSTLYGSTYELAPLFLGVRALVFLYAALGQFSIEAVLNGQGETRKSMLLGIANVALGLPLAITLVPRFQIIGVIATTLIAGAPQVIIGSIWVKRLYNISIEHIVAVKILLVSLVSGLATWIVINLINLPNWIQLAIGAAVLPATFLVLAPLTGIVSLEDIQNLRTIFSEVGPASKVLNIPLKIMSMLC